MNYRQDERDASKTNGWPDDTGPFQTLHDLGILPHDAQRPTYLNYRKVLTSPAGALIYKCSCKTLDRDGLRLLAALTFENWNVSMTSPSGTAELDIRITAAPQLTTTNTNAKD